MLPGPLTILLESPVLLDMPWLDIFLTTLDCVGPCVDYDINDMLVEYTCNNWSRVAEERPDAEQALFLRDALIIETLADNPIRMQYARGMRMRLQVAYALLEMQALAFGSTGCENCMCCPSIRT